MISGKFAFIAIFLYSFGLAFFENIYLSMFLAPLLVSILKHEAILTALKKLLFLNIFILFVCVSAVLNEEYNLALLIFLRSNAILFFTFLLFYKKDIFEITSSLSSLGVSPKLSSLFFFVAKFIFIIKSEFKTINKALKARNFHPKSNFFTYKIFANIIGMLVIKCFQRADKLKKSMLLRNFQGKIYQNRVEVISKIDLIIVVSVIFSLTCNLGAIKI